MKAVFYKLFHSKCKTETVWPRAVFFKLEFAKESQNDLINR